MAIHSRGNAVILVRPRSNLCWRTWEQPCLSSTAPCECILVRDTTISCRLLFLLWRVPSFHTCDKGSSITIRQVGIRVCMLSHVWLFATPWTIAHQAPLSMGFPRQEYWSGLPLPSPGDLPDPGTEPGSPVLHADSLPSEPPGKPKWLTGHHEFSRKSPQQ